MLPLASAPYTLPFVGPGTYLIFGIVLAPIYVMLAAWYLGTPSDSKSALLGVTYLAGLTTALWGGLFVATMVIKFAFF
ncbi:hypothetical protein [Halobacterium bonnevillei]|uniref:Yip1 domain-containing protein n=1 Tax=Halobacterium bonnevillei TaxID=2692200 RepID=A0A6B0SHC6_9EURY|nr:hypothetical protein [Halobacterium bonnevillei]MXR19946.1 hypothetical protein [Halobacterium bonnevillei]